MFEMTKGQRALSDLTIVLDTLDIEHPDIIQGWIDKIAAELAERELLLGACKLAYDYIEQYRIGNRLPGGQQWLEVWKALQAAIKHRRSTK